MIAGAKATVPKSNPPRTLLLPFGKNFYLVPAKAVESYAKFPNDQIKTGEDLGALLATKAPDKWKPYCKPDYLHCIEGDTGKCVYTTFKVPGHPDEERILRNISATVAAKNFSQVKQEALEKAKTEPITNERQQKRINVLEWNKDVDCPNRAQINPEIEKWEIATGDELATSCEVKPETKKRTKPGASHDEEAESKRKRYICHEEFVKQPPGTTYKINEVGGLLHVVFYRTAATVVGGEEEAEAEAEEP
jgi:hypothetical protein